MRFRILVSLSVGLPLCLAGLVYGTPPSEEAVALVGWMTGEAWMQAPSETPELPVALFDMLAPGSVVRTGAESEVVLVFLDGRRFAVGPRSRALVEADGPKAESGSLRSLEPVPSLARLPRIARSENPGKSPGARRIRHPGEEVGFELYPDERAAVSSDAATLGFTLVEGVGEYQVEVVDQAGQEVFSTTTRTSRLRMPADVLEPGATYFWRVSSKAGNRRTLLGSSLFAVLGEETARARRQLAEEVAASRDPGLALLSAEVDRGLGLRREACDALARAVARAPGNGALAQALPRFECDSVPLGGPERRPPGRRPPRGVVVERVDPESALERADVRPGDVLFSWEREDVRGEIRSVFDWPWLEVEQAPRGVVKLFGERQGEKKLFEVGLGSWGSAVRPRMPPALLADYRRGRELVEAKELEAGITWWEKVLERAEGEEELFSCWLRLRIAEAWGEALEWEKARATYRAASEVSEPLARVAVLDAAGKSYYRQDDLSQAMASYREALEIRRATWGENLSFARNLGNLGNMAGAADQFDLAEESLKKALFIRQKLAPLSLEVADSLTSLANLAMAQGDLEPARRHAERALEIQEKLAPEDVAMARILNGLGGVISELGERDLALEYLERGLEIHEKLTPGGFKVAVSLVYLGITASYAGKTQRADEYYLRALTIFQKLAPEHRNVALCLHNLALGAMWRGELDVAADYLERTLTILQKSAPESLFTAGTLNSLGGLMRTRGELELAKEFHQRALKIQQTLTPEGPGMADSLEKLGHLARARGDLDEAEEYYRRALEMREKHSPGNVGTISILRSLGRLAEARGELDDAWERYQRIHEIRRKVGFGGLGEAGSLQDLGRVATDRGEPELAETYLRDALTLHERLAPGSLLLAEDLNALGLVARDRGRLKPAAEYFLRSLDALEAQIGKLGDSQDVKGGFRARHGRFYQNAIEVLLERDRLAQAFAVLERFRARSFLEMLEERDLTPAADVPVELQRSRWQIARRYDETYERLLSLDTETEETEALVSKLAKLRQERRAVDDEIRQASPRLAALRDFRPLELAGVRQILDPGTVMLSYSVGKERGELFVLTREGDLEAHPLLVGEDELRKDVETLRELIQPAATGSRFGPDRGAFLDSVSRRLYQLLVAPAEKRLEGGDRILIVPDGPLHVLPFGALVQGHSGRYLAEWKPLHSALSATVYAQLQASRPGSGTREESPTAPRFVGFGDPYYSQDLQEAPRRQIADVRLRSAMERGLDLEALPATRRELDGIAGLFSPGTSRVYLGRQATEEQAKASGRGIRYLHFATHGFLDPRFPLDSSLALAVPEPLGSDRGNPPFVPLRGNGLLQAWEIFESVRLDADLVVLSACESGLGQELGGEGLIGLTRAFQYAGARSVAATLWKVDDEVTAELMVRLYRHLEAGRPKDVALRAAQIDFIHGDVEVTDENGQLVRRDVSAPYYWAAFQLIGDWK